MRLFLTLIMVLCMVSPSYAKVVVTPVDYNDGDVKLRGTLAYDDAVKAPQPGILLVPEWWGHNDYIKRRAKEMAEQGYVAFAVDMYGVGNVTTDAKQAQAWSGPFYKDRAMMRQRVRAGLVVLKQQPNVDKEKLAAIGFCMGGTVALELARDGEDLKGVATFHAGLQFPEPVKQGNVKAKVLVMNGAADPHVPFADRQKFIEDMQNAGADIEFIDYGHAVHAFTNPDADKAGLDGVGYNAEAEKRSFRELRAFFTEIFGSNAS